VRGGPEELPLRQGQNQFRLRPDDPGRSQQGVGGGGEASEAADEQNRAAEEAQEESQLAATRSADLDVQAPSLRGEPQKLLLRQGQNPFGLHPDDPGRSQQGVGGDGGDASEAADEQNHAAKEESEPEAKGSTDLGAWKTSPSFGYVKITHAKDKSYIQFKKTEKDRFASLVNVQGIGPGKIREVADQLFSLVRRQAGLDKAQVVSKKKELMDQHRFGLRPDDPGRSQQGVGGGGDASEAADRQNRAAEKESTFAGGGAAATVPSRPAERRKVIVPGPAPPAPAQRNTGQASMFSEDTVWFGKTPLIKRTDCKAGPGWELPVIT
jgi:hypothetical protein